MCGLENGHFTIIVNNLTEVREEKLLRVVQPKKIKKDILRRQFKRGVAPRPIKIFFVCLVHFIAFSIFSIV
jgi:hypothetical protein